MTHRAAGVRIQGSRLLLRAFLPGEIDAQWQAMRTADPMSIGRMPEEASFKDRLRRSGRMAEGWIDLAIALDGVAIGHIQTFVPPGRPLPPGTYDVGISLHEGLRGRGYGREALALFTEWLFSCAAAEVVEAPTDPANVAMRTVFERVGWTFAGTLSELDRAWVVYRITREQWHGDATVSSG